MDANNIIKQLEAIETLIQSTPSDTVRKVLQDEYKRLQSEYTKLLAKQKQQKQHQYIVTEQTKSKDIMKEKYRPDNEPHISEIEEGHILSFSIKPDLSKFPKYNGYLLSIKDQLEEVGNMLLDKIFDNEKYREEVLNLIHNKCYVQTKTIVNFIRDIPGELIKYAPRQFRHTGYRNSNDLVQNLEDLVRVLEQQLFEEVYNQIIEFQNNGSGWIFDRITKMIFRFIPYTSFIIKAKGYIPTPEWLENRKGVINIRNKDDRCFMKCIYRALNPDKNRNNSRDVSDEIMCQFLKQYDFSMFFDGDNILPVTHDNLHKFEEINKIGVHLFYIDYYSPDHTQHEYISMYSDNPNVKIITLGYFTKDGRSHFVIINKLITIMTDKITKCGEFRQYYVCSICVKKVRYEQYEEHIREYHTVKRQLPIIELPSNDIKIYYDATDKKNIQRSKRKNFVIYADIEATNVKIKLSDNTIKTKQIPNSYCLFCPDLYSVGLKNQYIKIFMHNNPDVLMKQFLSDLDNMTQCIKFHKDVGMVMSEDDIRRYNLADMCEHCGVMFGDVDDNGKRIYKVRHHDNITGKYMAAWCSRCNFLESDNNIHITVIMHNLRGYDSHHIIKYAGKYINNRGVDDQFYCGKSSEQFNYIRVGKYEFVDSYQHLKASLDKLVEFQTELPLCDKLNIHPLLRRKGVYPYSWVDDYNKFNHTTLPSIEAFYNDLEDKPCSVDEYNHAINVWNTLGCNTFKDYHIHYLKSDVILLADVFENYRNMCLKEFQLDPAQFISAPSLSYVAGLKFTGCKLDALTDINMYQFFHSALRGGLCNVGELTYCNVYDKQDEHIIGLDINSLYPYSLMFPMPISDFQWVTPTMDMINNYRLEDEYGYFIECDIHVPKSIHNKFSPYPLFPERIDGKLMCTLFDKDHYIDHVLSLQFGVKHGYVITKLHRAIKFKQSCVLADYMNYLLEKRKFTKRATFQDEFYKLLANSFFGKTIEDPLKYRNYKTASGRKNIIKLANNEHIIDFHKIDDEFILAELLKNKVMYKKPKYIGATILSISKVVMANYYYDWLIPMFGDNMKFIYTDTDSLVIWVKHPNLKQYMMQPENNEIFEIGEHNKRVPGRFKLEKDNIVEFKAYCPKQYYYIMKVGDKYVCSEKFKGIPDRCRTSKELTQTDIIQHLQSHSPLTPKTTYDYKHLRSHKHEIYVEDVHKEVTANDDKRYWLDDGIHTLAYGHYKLT
jgi:hypothetical protein